MCARVCRLPAQRGHQVLVSGVCAAALFFATHAAIAQIVVTPGAPAGLRQLCVDTSGNVTIDAALNTCIGGQTALTSISVGSGASTLAPSAERV